MPVGLTSNQWLLCVNISALSRPDRTRTQNGLGLELKRLCTFLLSHTKTSRSSPHCSLQKSREPLGRFLQLNNMLIDTSIQIDDDIDAGDEDLSGNKHNDDPLQVFTMRMTELVLEHSQQISNHTDTLLQ